MALCLLSLAGSGSGISLWGGREMGYGRNMVQQARIPREPAKGGVLSRQQWGWGHRNLLSEKPPHTFSAQAFCVVPLILQNAIRTWYYIPRGATRGAICLLTFDRGVLLAAGQGLGKGLWDGKESCSWPLMTSLSAKPEKAGIGLRSQPYLSPGLE